MKAFYLSAFLLASVSFSEAQVKMPAPSPTQSLKQDFSLSSVEVSYSRPAAKDRKIFGDLVPYGKLWRTGANAATTIRFNEPVAVSGKRVDTGTYALYTIPGEDNWEVILNKGTGNWGVDGYKEADDVVRVKVPAYKLKNEAENFTMQFDNIKPESMELHIMWDKTGVALPITVSIKDKLRTNIESALQSDKKPYWQAAQFYNEWDKNHAKALENISKAIDGNPKAFWMHLYKARIQKDMGDKAGALASSQKSLELAREAKNDDYVKLNQDFQKELK